MCSSFYDANDVEDDDDKFIYLRLIYSLNFNNNLHFFEYIFIKMGTLAKTNLTFVQFSFFVNFRPKRKEKN